MRILVVDDSVTVRKIIRGDLENGGYEVIEADDGDKALLEVANNNTPPPDLITLDVDMPVLNGFETCRKLRGQDYAKFFSNYEDRKVPVIFVTASDTLNDRKTGFELGAADFIAKPFMRGDLLNAANKILKPESILKGLTTLVVDDTEVARSIVSKSLISEGISVLTAENGVDAYEVFRANRSKINLVITDLEMPEMDGLELCKKIRAELGLMELPVIFLTSNDDKERLLEVFKAGGTDYLIKPFAKEEMLARINVHIEKTRLNKRLLKTKEKAETMNVELKSLTKQLEVEIARANEMAVKAEIATMSKSKFLSNMSHEIRTPLNAIVGMTDLVMDTKLDDEQLDYIESIRSSSDSFLELINNILDFSKIEADKLELENIDFDLRKITWDVMAIMSVKAHEQGLELAYHVSSDVPLLIVGDPTRTKQILINLIGNAIKFTKKGEVVLRVKREDKNKDQIELDFSIMDTGVGVPKSGQEKIFEPFSQADDSTTRSFGGTGLGLTITSQLVKAMNGKMWIESPAFKTKEFPGSIFHFKAIFGQSSKEDSQANAVPDLLEKLNGLRALVIDDNETNLSILSEILSEWGIIPAAYNNGKNALKAIEKNDREFQFAILDATMPDMDRFILAETLNEHRAFDGAIIIMLTLSGSQENDRHKMQSDFSYFINKPVRPDNLKKIILNSIGVAVVKRNATEEKLPGSDSIVQQLKILMAEDNKMNQKVAGSMLKKMGHSVVVANNGIEAVSAFENEKFDLILMDGQMPEMDGFEATRKIRTLESQKPEKSHIRIIALTANAMKGDRKRFIGAGMDDYIPKPVKKRTLTDVITRCMEKSTKELIEKCVHGLDDEIDAEEF